MVPARLLLLVVASACGFQISAGGGGEDGGDGGDGPVTVGFVIGGQTLTEAAVEVAAEVRLSRPSATPISVAFEVTGTATEPADYSVTTTSPLVFAPGEVSQTIRLTVVADQQTEGAEEAALSLTSATFAALGATTTHRVTILDAGTACYGAGAYATCFLTTPTGVVMLPAMVNTNAGSSDCATSQAISWTGAQGQPEACFITGGTITVADTTVTGSRPLVLVASDAIVVNGTLDASSRRDPVRTGPGSPSPDCTAFPELDEDSSGGGGGAGGSFASRGGKGGNGKGASGGSAHPPVAAVSALRAGCRGQRGGDGDVPAAPPGRGGGVVYLVAGNALTINASGIINVSGSGAGSAGDSTGGSGGGSAGMIKLHAPTVTMLGRLVANGGGGSSGADDNGGSNPGGDPDPSNPATPAVGGSGPTQSGGDGYAGTSQAEGGDNASGGSANAGGGGGGGGGGLIESNVSLPATGVSAAVVNDP